LNILQYLILATEYKGDDALNRRLFVGETHLKRVLAEKAESRFIIGGIKLNEQALCITRRQLYN